MMQRAASTPPTPKPLVSGSFTGISIERWQKIQKRAAESGIPLSKPAGSFSMMGNTVCWSLMGNFLKIDVMEAAFMNPEDVLSFVSDMINQAIA